MKMESPLDVLSRAASLVQSEENIKLCAGGRIMVNSTDSGFEDDATHSPSSPIQQSPKRHVQEENVGKSVRNQKLGSFKEDVPNSLLLHPIKGMLKKESLPPAQFERFDSSVTEYIKHQGASVKHTYKDAVLPPPLISISKQFSNFSSKLPTYESLFPRPSVISTSQATCHTEHYTEKKSCKCCNIGCCTTFSSRYTPYKRQQKMKIPQGFELPTVEDHFRKSLGEKYDISKKLDERPSSVDEHFAKALGTNWYSYTT